ncbi:hypothetical protein [Acinetobacter baumannii]|uniref:hypothetical protein n=1 Tax=Acinetobacter baumannii TaxID=470 RepID=UPI001C0BB5DC|nr:hypothetical protein [Acinetobacter baumannii]MBU3169587.1 hypothetical protein [Acinetobacter baumannii]MDV4217627.1 hypothetical protein [Acinetobacter baumannii]MDV7457706.1 hypothetical protein [Acinetobacter baumannii]
MGIFTCILSFSLLIYILIIYPLDGDKASSLASMFGFAATLFAPIAALFVLDNWKIQKKYEMEKEIIVKIIDKITLIDRDLKKFCTYHFAIEKIKNEIIALHNYKEFNVSKRQDQLLELAADIKLISLITKDEVILSLYNQFEGQVLHLDKLNKIFYLSLYPPYYEKIDRPFREQTILEKGPYKSDEEKESLASEITNICRFYQNETSYTYSIEINNIIYYSDNLSFFKHYEKYKNLESSLLNTLINKITPNNSNY